MESIFDSIVILKSNPVYRISDVFFRKGNRWEEDRNTILTDDKYKDSILREYLLNKKGEHDFSCLRKVIENHSKKYSYPVPSANDLVVHIRTGDVFGTDYRPTAKPKRWSYSNVKRVISKRFFNKKEEKAQSFRMGAGAYDGFFEKVDVDSLDVSKIMVVSAMHFGANDINGKYFYEEVARERSLELLNNFKDKCDEKNIEVGLYSSEDADKDLAYMCHSRYFVKGNTNMSDIIEKCLIPEAKVFEVLTPNAKMLKYRNI